MTTFFQKKKIQINKLRSGKETEELLIKLMKQKILILDGAMGTEIQKYRLQEADYRGDGEFKEHPKELKGNSDILVLTKPSVIEAIHKVI